MIPGGCDKTSESAVREPAVNRKLVVCVSGAKYTLRSNYTPFLRELCRVARIKLCVLDYPEDYSILGMLDEMLSSKIIESYVVVPAPRRAWKHHRAVKNVCRLFQSEHVDLLIMGADFMPMHRYFIGAARSTKTPIFAIQTEAQTHLLASYVDAIERDGESLEAGSSSTQDNRLSRVTKTLVLGPARLVMFGRILKGLKALSVWSLRILLDYKILPLLFGGRTFNLHRYERDGVIRFATTRVDATIVYRERTRQALRFFVPGMNVHVAEHPLSNNCRCRLDGSVYRKLLVLLGGPWEQYISLEDSAESIEKRWCDAIMQAHSIGDFSEVHVRGHPRERMPYPRMLAERLTNKGLKAQVIDPSSCNIADSLCNYAGLIGVPSGALTEAINSCRRAFVIALDSIEGDIGMPRASEYGDEIVMVPRGTPLKPEYFSRTPINQTSGDGTRVPTVYELITRLAEWGS